MCETCKYFAVNLTVGPENKSTLGFDTLFNTVSKYRGIYAEYCMRNTQ